MGRSNVIRGRFGIGRHQEFPAVSAQSLYNMSVRRLGELDQRIHQLRTELDSCTQESEMLSATASNLRRSVEHQQF